MAGISSVFSLIMILCSLILGLASASNDILVNTENMIRDHLDEDGKIVLESGLGTDMPDVFQKMGWQSTLHANYMLEYAIGSVTAVKVR